MIAGHDPRDSTSLDAPVPGVVAAARAGAAIFRTDLYRRHMRAAGADLPGASMKIEGTLTHPTAVASERGTMILAPDRFFDGWIFDPPVD